MKNLLYSLNLLMIILLSSLILKGQSINNASFENWSTGPSGFLDPDGWQTNNANIASVIQSPGHIGTYACKLITVPSPGSTPYGGHLTYGSFMSMKPIALSGFYKLVTTTNDGISIHTVVEGNFGATVIGTSSDMITQVNTNWTPFTDSIIYTLNITPFDFNLTINYYPAGINLNGFAEIDDLSLAYVTGINDTIIANFPSANLIDGAYSNSYNLLIDIISRAEVTTQVYDIQGKKLNMNTMVVSPGHHEISLDLNNYQSGIYIFVVTLANKQYTFKLNKV